MKTATQSSILLFLAFFLQVKLFPIQRGRHSYYRKLMNTPKVFADFHNADAQGRLRLNCIGTVKDLARQNVELQDG